MTDTRNRTDYRDAPFREVDFMPVDLAIERRGDGTLVIGTNVPTPDVDANIPRDFARSAAAKGDATAIAVRGADGAWHNTSYAELKRQIDGATQSLIDHVPAGRSVIVMGENSVASAVMQLACYAARVIHTPVSPAYGLSGGDHARLRHVIAKVKPAAIYADPLAPFAKAIAETKTEEMIVISTDPAPFGVDAVALAELTGTEPTDAVADSIEKIDVEDVASHMMTSGSTGLPKVVQLSLAAITANTSQAKGFLGRIAGWGDVMLDWLPWHHAAGASVLRTTLLEGGALHVDHGKPVPGLFDASIRNLSEIAVSYYNNVPSGYALLVDALETNAELRRTFFSKMLLMLYGGAGLPQHVYDRLQTLAVEETGHRIHMTTGYGMTEMVSGCMAIHFPTDRVGIGLPGPGLEVKLVPYDERYEVRLRGGNRMKGYLDEPERTAAAFDEEGFYKTGDLARFHDDARPEEGLAFAGRLAEEFKLANGTWVYGGQLREGLLKALTGLVAELVLCDDNRPYLALLVWPRPDAPADVLDQIAARLAAFNKGQQGGSATIRRVALLATPPSVDAHEISDKATINRRAVLDNRQADVERLFADPPGDGVREV